MEKNWLPHDTAGKINTDEFPQSKQSTLELVFWLGLLKMVTTNNQKAMCFFQN